MTSNANTERAGRARAWQRMLSGRRLDLLNPDPNDIAIEDIAHGLSRVARWNGQTSGEHVFTVAQHSLLVEHIVGREHPEWPDAWLLGALLHDAPEYVVGDLISPFKAAIGIDYKAFEIRLLEAIHLRFDLPERLPEDVTAAIKDADRVAAYFEATLIAGFEQNEAMRFFGHPPEWPAEDVTRIRAHVMPMPLTTVHKNFLVRFAELTKDAGTSPK